MRIQADTQEELDEAIAGHEAHGLKLRSIGNDGTQWIAVLDERPQVECSAKGDVKSEILTLKAQVKTLEKQLHAEKNERHATQSSILSDIIKALQQELHTEKMKN